MPHTNLSKKSIITYIPNHVGLPDMFRENLTSLGLTVYTLPTQEPKRRITIKDIIIHNLRKIFKGDLTYKKNILKKNRQQDIVQANIEILNTIHNKTDYALIIRSDLLPDEVLKKIKNSTRKMIGYQWDGLDRFPMIYTKINFFDKFFVFDKKDVLVNNNLKLITNFYFDHMFGQKEVLINDVFFIGSYVENRMKTLTELASLLKNSGFVTDINVVISQNKHILPLTDSGINLTTEIFDFKKNYQHIKKTKAILDLLDDAHSGLSLRVFEAIGFRKKLITNNPEVKKYDFYNSNNIFIIGEENIENLKCFMERPYENLSEDIRYKYGFENWLRNILDIPEYVPIVE